MYTTHIKLYGLYYKKIMMAKNDFAYFKQICTVQFSLL